MSKVKVYEKNSVASIINERKLLAQLRHPFIINMHYAFEDRENLYIIMDYLSGGDLRYHICKQRKFDEEQTSISF
jgi:serum/glucocorticoid-regulated kinase 2